MSQVGSWGGVRLHVAQFLANLWQGPCSIDLAMAVLCGAVWMSGDGMCSLGA
jgi:hypothetical protein